MIPQSFLDDLLDRVDIVEVVDQRVKLRKTGKNYSACCPFHDEKTPSFTVSPDKQFYYCFGCGASGNALGFIMDYERLDFRPAVELLAHNVGLKVPEEERSERDRQRGRERDNLYQLLEKTNDWFRAQLGEHPASKEAQRYLKMRGLDDKVVADYGIGYAPPGWDNLLKALGKDEASRQALIAGGTLIHQPEQNKTYDRFRHRIIFPIRDLRGRVIGFGGRVLGDDKPKYLNSPETPVFHKSRELYGLYEARQAYRQLPRLLVVEGYMDVVSLAQFGIRYGVATMGTACGEEHLERAFRHTGEIVFCFDGDRAGRGAALRALENALPVMQDGRRIRFLFLPEGEDPDTLVRDIGADKFERMIERAVPMEDYLFDAAAEGLNPASLEGRAQMSTRLAPMLHKLPKGIFRELMFDSLARRTGLNRQSLEELLRRPPERPPRQERPPRPEARPEEGAPPQARNAPASPDAETPPPDYPDYYHDAGDDSESGEDPGTTAPSRRHYRMPPAHKAVALLLTYPDLAATETDHEFWLHQPEPDLQRLGRLLRLLHQRPHYQMPHIIGYWRGTHGAEDTEQLAAIAGHDLLRAARDIASPRQDKPPKADYDARAAFADCLTALRRQLDAAERHQSLQRLKTTDFSQLTREEREQLVRRALADKMTRP